VTNGEATQIVRAIEKLGDQLGETREDFAKHTGRVEAQLEGVGKSLRRVDKRLDRTDEVQREQGERIAKVETAASISPDATGRHQALPLPPPAPAPSAPQAPARPWSIPPEVRRERIRQVGKVVAIVVTVAGMALLGWLGLSPS
jgi:hypothetical protein